MLIRIRLALSSVNTSSKDEEALTLASIVLGNYVVDTIGALAFGSYLKDGTENMRRRIWNGIDILAIVSLLIGVCATLSAVWLSEGLEWGAPKPLVGVS